MDKYQSGIGFSAGKMMLNWDLMDTHIKPHPIKIIPGDSVNVFINFESILYNLTMQKNLNTLIHNHKQNVVIELESAILNVMAIYRMYFSKREKCDTKIYFYYTDIKSDGYNMAIYNKNYRSYYRNKYLQNPQFKDMGCLMKDIIIPEIKMITEYIPGCYFLTSEVLDGSLIPKIVSEFSDSKNVIITADIYDTLYMFDPNFITLYIKRRFKELTIYSDVESTVRSIIKDENPFDLTIFNSEMYYKLLLSIRGSKIRNIKSARGFGYSKFVKLIKEGIYENSILKDFKSIDSIASLFPGKYKDDIIEAFKSIDIDIQYQLITEIDKQNIRSQTTFDKVDNGSLEALNNKRFFEYPINLSGLLG